MRTLLTQKLGNKKLGLLLVLFSAISFSSKGVLIKLMYQYNKDHLTALALRMLIALPFYLFFVLKNYSPGSNQAPLSKSDYVHIVWLGVVGYYISSLLDFWGLVYINANLERLILFVYPSFVVLLSFIIFKKKPNKNIVIALASTYLGVLLVFGYDAFHFGTQVWIGAGLVLASAFTYAFYLVYSDGIIKKLGSIRFTAFTMTLAGVCVMIQFLLTRPINLIFDLSFNYYLLGILLGIFGTVLPTFAISAGIKLIGSGNSAITATLGPVWTLILAFLVLGEPITFIQVVGTILVILGVYISYKD